MAIIVTAMNKNNEHGNRIIIKPLDDHEDDVVMPGFRFHPTEEELVEFYLRRKVEGKRFNIELVTYLDLYRYDPWELPALAAIGEKEWYFYVPRDRKYRNGDRPNRVTTSGYWKATGADRMIRSENFRSIGLKKTLVFYSGKAPKGIRTSWIMNEYRLPHHETERLQKAEISLCRVYKRAGVEDHPSLTRSIQTKPSSLPRISQQAAPSLKEPMQIEMETSPKNIITTNNPLISAISKNIPIITTNSSSSSSSLLTDQGTILHQSNMNASDNDLHNLVNNSYYHQPQPEPLVATNIVYEAMRAGASDRLWVWSSAASDEASKDYSYTNLFK